MTKFFSLFFFLFTGLTTSGAQEALEESSITLSEILQGIRKQEVDQKSFLKNYSYIGRIVSGKLHKNGEIEEENLYESRVFVRGDLRKTEILKIIRKGKELTKEEIEEERSVEDSKREENRKRWERFFSYTSPFNPEMEKRYLYQLLWEERMGDRMTYLLKVKAREKDEALINGFFWVDQETFGVIESRTKPAKNPKHIKSMKTRFTAEEVEEGIWLPHTIRTEVTGGFLFFKKKFGILMTFEDYQLNIPLRDDLFQEKSSDELD